MTADSTQTISEAEMVEALLRSGYLLEARVEAKLRRAWGYVETNPTYVDPDTGKSREFDLFAMTARNAGTDEHDFVFAEILAECINNPQPFVVMTKDPLVPFLHHEEVKMSGLPVKIENPDGSDDWQSLSDFLEMNSYHHYCNGRVGTQFCSFARKKTGRSEEWMATHEGAHYESLRKICDVVEHRLQQSFADWTLTENEAINVEIYYPVIILQGELIEARQSRNAVKLRPANHVRFRRSRTQQGATTDYQIDIIRERYLDKYLRLVTAELEKTARLMKRRASQVRSAINKIAAAGVGVTDAQQKRQIMDY